MNPTCLNGPLIETSQIPFKYMESQEVFSRMLEPDVGEQHCGTLGDREKVSDIIVERMKIVFRKTHGGEMTQEDRDFLGIPPCTGECCPS